MKKSDTQPNDLPTLYKRLDFFGFERAETETLISSEIIFVRDITPSFSHGDVHIQTVELSWDLVPKAVVMRTHVLYRDRSDPNQATWGHDYKGLTSDEIRAFLDILDKLEEAQHYTLLAEGHKDEN